MARTRHRATALQPAEVEKQNPATVRKAQVASAQLLKPTSSFVSFVLLQECGSLYPLRPGFFARRVRFAAGGIIVSDMGQRNEPAAGHLLDLCIGRGFEFVQG